MGNIQLNLTENNNGGFYYMEEGQQLGEMVIAIKGTELIVYHTVVDPAQEGKGIAGKLLAEMVSYARANHLTVVPLCPYVAAQFKRHPDLYADLWKA